MMPILETSPLGTNDSCADENGDNEENNNSEDLDPRAWVSESKIR